ncbi:hypothetical protein FQZ97_425450 [compost metagenome]
MNEEVIAKLVGRLTFDVDPRGFIEFRKRLLALQKQVDIFRKSVDKKFGIKAGAFQSMAKQLQEQQKLTKIEFAQQMQASKLTLANAKSATQQAQEQTKQSLLQAKVKKAALQHSLLAEKAAHQLRQQAARTAAAEARAKTALGKAQAWADAQTQKKQQQALRQQQRQQWKQQQQSVSRVPAPKIPHFGNGGLGAFAGRMSVGPIVAPSMAGLAGAAGGATIAIAALAAAAVAASTAFAEAAQRAGDTRDVRLAQFKSMTGSDQGAKEADARYLALANKLGLDAARGGRDYAKLTGALARKVGVEKAESTASGILSYGKAQGATNEELAGLNRGLLQALGKNQLFSEEWTGQIAEHLGARANEFGAEAYQRAIGGNKTGQDAEDQFRKDREERKIAGKTLQKFLVELGSVLGQHANDGGALDVAVNTGESSKARLENQMQDNLSHAYDANDQKLRNSVAMFNKAKFELLKELGPQFDKFGSVAADVLTLTADVINKVTDLVRIINSGDFSKYFDTESLNDFKASFEGLSKEMGESFDQLDKLWSSIWGDTTPRDVGSFVLDVLSKVMAGMATALDISQAALGVITDIVNKIRSAAESLGIVDKRKPDEDGVSGDTPRIQGQFTPIPKNEEEANTIPRGLMPNLDGVAIPRAGGEFIPAWMQGLEDIRLPDISNGAAMATVNSQTTNTVNNVDSSVTNDITQNLNVTVNVPDNVAGLSGVKSYLENELPLKMKEMARAEFHDQVGRSIARLPKDDR